MKIGSSAWLETIAAGAAAMGIHLDPAHGERFAVHAMELEAWNRKINLTAIVDPAEVAVKHFLDALAVLPFIPGGSRLLDMGSGAGFPGIPLKVADPSLSVVLIDASRKKVHFQQHVIRRLGLRRIEAHHIRAEAMGGRAAFAGGFDVIVSRALTDLKAFASLAGPLLRPKGRIIAMKGKWPDAEPRIAGSYAVTVKRYVLPSAGQDRSLVILDAVGPDAG